MAKDFSFTYFEKGFHSYNPVRVFFGENMLERLSEVELPGKKAFIGVTPERFYVDRVCAQLDKTGVDYYVYDRIQPNPINTAVNEAAAVAKKEGCDFVLSIGGGSTTDTCKAVAVLLKNEGDIWDYVGDDVDGVRVAKEAMNGAAPIVVVSTTAGTGTEMDQSAVIMNAKTLVKSDLSKDYLFSTLTIIDPVLQTTVPKGLTASQGMDLIFHVAEGLLTKGCEGHILAESLGKPALELASKSLVEAYINGDNLPARKDMAYACMLSGMLESMIFLKSLHGIGMALNCFSHTIPHGVSMCIVSIECFKIYVKDNPERASMLSEWVGYGHRPEGLVEFLIDIQKKLDMYYIDYKKYGLDVTHAREYAEAAVNAGNGLWEYDEHRLTVDETTKLIEDAFARCDGKE